MAYFTEYKKQSEPGKRARAQNWAVAIGLQMVDNLTPSKYLIDVARDNIEGKISIDDAQREINHYYRQNIAITPKEQDEQQADMVSARIAKLLGEKTFSFSPAEYKSIHGALFDGVLDADTVGKFRTYNITKKEPVLNGDTVVYGRADSIAETLEYDFERERNFDYSRLTREQRVAHVAKFMSGIWQIHPFAEGNTRATVVFIIKYLDTLGMHTNNDLFERHAKYFRNALVRANYQNLDRQIPYTTEFLDKFFGNLLLGENNRLDNREMQIKTTQKKTRNTTQKTAQKILDVLSKNPKATRSELAGALGLSADGIKWNLDKLKKSGQIRRIGPDKGGHWEVIKK
ncbi:MAG: Fic family protein [Alphaproteobacteria bacterium]|nr:Fic family protein [Alphaproteobacteria bacterium]